MINIFYMVKDRLFIKMVDNHFMLHRIKDGILTIEGDSEFMIGGIEPFYKLSKQNCLNIINGYDLDRLATVYAEQSMSGRNDLYDGFKAGFQKALELLEHKKYTEDDLLAAYDACWDQRHEETSDYTVTFNKFVQSLNKNEWDVEIVLKNSRTGAIINNIDFDLEWDEDGLCDRAIPKLDKDGCIILKLKNE